MADIAVEATAITVEVIGAQGLTVDAPSIRVEHGGVINIDGTGDVVGPNGVEAGRPARFADSSGKVIEAAPVNSPGGLVVLDGDATLPDILLPASIARDSEVTSAISAATAGMVIDTDPRLSDARTPLAHTHPATAVSTVPATTGLDPASTNVEAALTELAARPSGSGGLWEVVSTQTLEAASPAISFTGLTDFKEVEIRWSGRATSISAQAVFLQIQFNADSSPTYHRSIFYRQSSFVSFNGSDQTSGWVGLISGSQTNTNRRSFGTIYVPCDQPSTDHKTAYGDFSCLPSTSTQVAVGSAAVGWANTSDAITSLTLSPSGGQFQVGCEFELLGRR